MTFRRVTAPVSWVSAWAVMGLASLPALAQSATTAGTATAPFPTLRALSIDWPIAGDDDNDGVVTVRFRPVGGTFADALPLVRVPAGSGSGFSWLNRHAGSVFDLQPGTDYDVELTLTDADGGSTTQTLTVSTRPVPQAATDAVLIDVTPASFADALSSVQAGQVVVLAPGAYAGFTVGADGTEQAPIVIRGTERDGVIVDGDVRMDGRSFVFLESVTVRGQVKFNASEGLVVRGCRIEAVADGIVSFGTGTINTYVADNIVTGPTTEWVESALGVNGDNLGEGIALTGPGNVVEFNFVRGFRDCLSTLEDSGAVNQTSIDFMNNDVELCADDGIEADFTMGNTRVVRNRVTNSFIAISSQPSLGGPSYFIRNVVFNTILTSFKLQRGSVGDLLFHNTVVKGGDAFGIYTTDVFSRTVTRNNLFIGGLGGGTFNGFSNGDGAVLELRAASDTCDFNHDGFASIGTGRFDGIIGDVAFDGIDALRATTSETDAVAVDLDVFATLPPSLADGPFPLREPPDLRLQAGAAVDVGLPLAQVNAGYAGGAPDLGAYELGEDLPVYGPRVDVAEGEGEGAGEGEGEGEGEEGEGEEGEGEGEGEDGEGEGEGPAGEGEGEGEGEGSGSDPGCGCASNRTHSAERVSPILTCAVVFVLLGRTRRRLC